jgi:hypothetical protein
MPRRIPSPWGVKKEPSERRKISMALTRSQENLEATLASCQRVLSALDNAHAAVDAATTKADLSQMMTTMGEVKEKFFMKTNPSIPPTVTCKKAAAQLEELAGKGDWTGFGAAFTKFQHDVKALVEKAKMEGTTIT